MIQPKTWKRLIVLTRNHEENMVNILIVYFILLECKFKSNLKILGAARVAGKIDFAVLGFLFFIYFFFFSFFFIILKLKFYTILSLGDFFFVFFYPILFHRCSSEKKKETGKVILVWILFVSHSTCLDLVFFSTSSLGLLSCEAKSHDVWP